MAGFLFLPVGTSLLIPENPLVLLPSLARLIGVEEAIAAQQLHFCLSVPRSGVEMNGEKWIYNTYDDWQRDHFPFWTIATIQRVFDTLEKMMIVESSQPEGRDSRRKYYRLNRGMIPKLTLENAKLKEAEDSKLLRTGHHSKLIRSERINLLRSCAGASNESETTTETTREISDDAEIPEQSRKGSVSVRGLSFAKWFRSLLPEDNKPQAKWVSTWARCYDEMIRIDKRDPLEIAKVCKWARLDDFWKANFLSPLKLRKRDRDGVMFYDRFLEGCQKRNGNGHCNGKTPIVYREV